MKDVHPDVQSGLARTRGSGIARYLFITITLLPAFPTHLHAQQMTTQAPPLQTPAPPLPDTPDYPTARTLLPPPSAAAPIIESDTQTYRQGHYTLDGAVVITAGDRRVQADHIEYDTDTGDLTATGHLLITGGPNDERLQASHGNYNLKTATGRFFDVTGSVGIRRKPGLSTRVVYTNNNPFLFTGRIVVKTGADAYDIYDGTVTSCQLPKPDWIFSASHFAVADDKVHARNSTFRLLNTPLFFLPYLTAPTNSETRQTGFLIPAISQYNKSGSKGVRIGEQIYVVLGRSADLIVGADYYSSIGFAQNATFRFKGPGLDFANLHYTGVLDRRIGVSNQGGEDVVFAGRHDFTPNTRIAANLDYLSSYIYREAFTDNFNEAVTSDIVSTIYGTRNRNGIELAALADRYQGIKTLAQAPTAANPAGIPQSQVRIFHAPTISFDSTDHALPGTATRFGPGLLVSLESSASGLKRTQPNFVTSGIVERFDLHPQLAYPIAFGPHGGQSGETWHLLPTVAARETLYTRSRVTPVAGKPPLESQSGLSRSDFEFAFDVRPPVLERTFAPHPGIFTRIFGDQVRHTIEPELTYRLTTGVQSFTNILRFDATDVVSNTNEAEYGVTQRLFRKVNKPGPCITELVATEPGFSSTASDDPNEDPTANPATTSPDRATQPLAPPTNCNHSEALVSWRLTQKYFFDPTFGGAIVNSRRNIFQTTLDLSGIAFLTERRDISPLLSRLRVRTSAHTDVEWDFDLDTGARKFTSSNVFLDLHQGQYFSAVSYARLDAPGRFYTQNPDTSTTAASAGVSSSVSDFNQLRFLIGYGNPAKPGLSLAANTGLDLKSLYGTTSNTTAANGDIIVNTVYPALLQYATVQGAYNFNCCGFSVEYRQSELGSVHNAGYKFSFTLVNIGTAGNLKHAERLF